MTRDEAIEHLIAVLAGDVELMLREKLITAAAVVTQQQKDYDALVAIGVKPEEITEAQQRL
jgi:hypothetical protein